MVAVDLPYVGPPTLNLTLGRLQYVGPPYPRPRVRARVGGPTYCSRPSTIFHTGGSTKDE